MVGNLTALRTAILAGQQLDLLVRGQRNVLGCFQTTALDQDVLFLSPPVATRLIDPAASIRLATEVSGNDSLCDLLLLLPTEMLMPKPPPLSAAIESCRQHLAHHET